MDITDIGPFKKISVPKEWRRNMLRVPQANRIDLPVLQLTLPGKEDELEIGIFYRGRLESEDDGENFHALLEQHRGLDTPMALGPVQIRSITRILNLAGFNQYSFPRHLSGYSPDFHLRTAQVMSLNGRPVLRVDGEFRADIAPDTYYGCLFVEADDTGRKIYEMYLRANSRDTFFWALSAFNQIASSVEWV